MADPTRICVRPVEGLATVSASVFSTENGALSDHVSSCSLSDCDRLAEQFAAAAARLRILMTLRAEVAHAAALRALVDAAKACGDEHTDITTDAERRLGEYLSFVGWQAVDWSHNADTEMRRRSEAQETLCQ